MEMICSFFVASWTGVVRYHGPRPSIRPKQVHVSFYKYLSPLIVLLYLCLIFYDWGVLNRSMLPTILR